MLDSANADLSVILADEADALADKYASGSPSSVDDELATLKAKLGK